MSTPRRRKPRRVAPPERCEWSYEEGEGCERARIIALARKEAAVWRSFGTEGGHQAAQVMETFAWRLEIGWDGK